MEQLFWIVVSSVAPKQCCCASEKIIYRKALSVASKRSGIHGRALLRSSGFTSVTKLYTFSCIMGFSYSALVSLSDWQLAGEGAPRQLPGKIAHQESFHSISNFHVVFQMQLLLHKKPLQTLKKTTKIIAEKLSCTTTVSSKYAQPNQGLATVHYKSSSGHYKLSFAGLLVRFCH